MVFLNRRFVLIPLCLALFLAACAKNAPAPKAHDPILPPEEFKVHPSLLGHPAPPELQPLEAQPIKEAPDADALKDKAELRP